VRLKAVGLQIFSTVIMFAGGVSAVGGAEQHWRVSDSSPCFLFTPVKSIDDGQGETPVALRLDAKRLYVTTSSNIDAEFGDLGISVDGKDMVMIDSVVRGTNVVFEAGVPILVEQFIAGRNATLQLRFWPTWPSTGPKTVDFSLIGFTKAHNQMQECQ
jgi:hypothetical protein